MKKNRISLLAVMLVCCVNAPVDARVNVRKAGTYANAYNQVMNVRQQAYIDANQPTITTASASELLPVTVDDKTLADNILNNSATDVDMTDLENCSMIYPNGVFKWAVPMSGTQMNRNQQCVAVVELRDTNTNSVLATTTLAAGDIMQCNIDKFPESGWQTTLGSVELPADAAPTLKEVEQVMNEEQKQNAGLKIAAAVIVSGVAGNMLAPKPAGDDKLLGTSKNQLTSTAIAAASGGGIMAASVYSGKVVGDTIKSTAVNAATGAVIGNMKAGQSAAGSALSIVKCVPDGYAQEVDCIPGNIRRLTKEGRYNYHDENTNKVYLINRKHVLWECNPASGAALNNRCSEERVECYNIEITKKSYTCKQISSSSLVNMTLLGSSARFEEVFKSDKSGTSKIAGTVRYNKDEFDYFEKVISPIRDYSELGDSYMVVETAQIPQGNAEHAYAVFTKIPKKIFGYKSTDWDDSLLPLGPTYYSRNGDGSVGNEIRQKPAKEGEDGETAEEITFSPIELNASDGALVDFSNAARAKDTIAGAAVGGALGGFAGYQGAKQEIQERWVSAQREYADSLSNFYCATGTRYLSQYNDEFIIPKPQSKDTNQ